MPVGVVTAIAARSRFRVTVRGRQDHAGGTAMAIRRDALAAAAELVLSVDFPVLARAFGAHGERVVGLDGLGGALEVALARSGRTVLKLPLVVDPPWEL